MNTELSTEAIENLQKYEQISSERKQLQKEGLLPDWYITQGWQLLKQNYLVEGEDALRGRHRTIAKTLAQYMGSESKYWEGKFFDILWSGVFSPATPVLANTGTDRGMNVSCSGQFVSDDVDSFYTNLRETALLSKNGFGTSADFSSIRPRGAPISKGGTASGPVPVMEDFFTTASKISQGGQRRGAVAAYLDIEHPDWDEAIDLLNREPNGKNFGWTVRDSFVEKLKQFDLEAMRRFNRAMYVKLVTGKGYFFFVDKANRARPQMYKDLNLDVRATNLCVAPETLILTDKGHVTISTLENQEVKVWNGEEWSSTIVRKTGENQKLVKVITDSGFELECTPEHKFYVQTDYGDRNVSEVRAKDLQTGDKLIKLNTEAVEGSLELEDAYENGFYTGDGCEVNGRARVYLYADKRELSGLFPNKHQHYIQEAHDREYFNVEGLLPKFFVPDSRYTIQTRIQWFMGLFDADGHLALEGESQTIQLASVNPEFLGEVQLMLQTLGVQSKVKPVREAGSYSLPDGRGGMKDYPCQAVYRLLISGNGVHDLVKLGFNPHTVQVSDRLPQRNAERFVTVLRVEDHGRISDTFCFTEPKRHMGVFNGILTGQCTEIMLHSSEDYTYSCILGSMNLAHWDKIKDSDAVATAMVFLDCLCEDFIQKSEGVPGLERVREFTIKGRATGLGAMGFHTYLQSKGIPYESIQAQTLSTMMAKHISEQSLKASRWLANEKGEPEWCKGYGVRNTHRTAYAPTKSTALLMGGVSESWSPDPGMVFEMSSAVGELRRIPPMFYKMLVDKGQYNEKNLEAIINNVGSAQGLDFLSDDEKLLFKNAYEIDQRVIYRHAKLRQRHTCQGQSLNFFIADKGSENLISELMTRVFLDEDILSQYYFYSKSGVVVSDECVACSA